MGIEMGDPYTSLLAAEFGFDHSMSVFARRQQSNLPTLPRATRKLVKLITDSLHLFESIDNNYIFLISCKALNPSLAFTSGHKWPGKGGALTPELKHIRKCIH